MCIILMFVLGVWGIGLPIETPLSFGLLLVLIFVMLFVPFSSFFQNVRWHSAALLVLVGIKAFLPVLSIEEGHNLLLPQTIALMRDRVPIPIQREFQKNFDRVYPIRDQCAVDQPGCWLQAHPQTLYGFSATRVYQTPVMTRQVSRIDIQNLTALRLTVLNDSVYNFYEGVGTVPRKSPPFFLTYIFPKEARGGALNWEGFQALTDSGSVSGRALIVDDDVIGRPIYFYTLGKGRSFSLTFSPPPLIRASNFLRDVLSVLVVIGVVLSIGDFKRYRDYKWPLLWITGSGLTAYLITPTFLEGFPIFKGGGDGLIYAGFARDMLEHLIQGNWAQVLRGGEDVYYFMPGFRYFKMGEGFLFGDTAYGYMLYVLFFPAIVFFFCRQLFRERMAIILTTLFVYIPIAQRFGFAEFLYLREASKGHAEPLGYGLFLMGAGVLLKHLRDKTVYETPLVGMGILFALSIWVRPNLGLAVGILLAGYWWYTPWWRWSHYVALGSGLSPVGLMGLHNWYFGEVFCMLTSAALHPTNLRVRLTDYWETIIDLFLRRVSSAQEVVLDQLYGWNKWTDGYRLLGIIALCLGAFERRWDPAVRVLCWSGLSMHTLLLFYVPSGRYAHLAWFISFVILVRVGMDLIKSRLVCETHL